MVAAFAKTSFVAMTDHQAILKNVPAARPHRGGRRAIRRAANAQGPVEGLGTANINLPFRAGARDESLAATIEGDRLTIGVEGMDLVFDRED